MTQLPLDHTAVAVPSLEDAIALYESITGARATPIETLESQGVRVAFVGELELIEPLGPDTPSPAMDPVSTTSPTAPLTSSGNSPASWPQGTARSISLPGRGHGDIAWRSSIRRAPERC